MLGLLDLVVELLKEEIEEEIVNKTNNLQVGLMEESVDKLAIILEVLLNKDVKIVSQKIDRVDKVLVQNSH